MKLILVNPRGFCAGVVRAIDTVKRALELWGPPIYVKHEIVHNHHVVDELKALGAIFIENLDEVPLGKRLIYSAHGVDPAVRDHAKKRNLIEIDATCGLVTRVHSAVKRYASMNYKIILIGHHNHVEIIGTKGEAPEVTWIVGDVDDVAMLPFTEKDKLFYITQTTLSIDDVKQIVQALKSRFPSIITLPTSSICYATTNRQQALMAVIENIDLILVIGDQQSSNSNRLKELGVNRGKPSYLINDPDEIQSVWLDGCQAIAVTAGASTPEPLVKKCVKKLQDLGILSVEEFSFSEENVFFQLPKELQVTR